MSEIPTFAMSDDDLDGIEALAEACKPWNPLREASEALVGEVRRLRAELKANREHLAKLIETDSRIRPDQFAWLVYPTYMRGLKAGMEHAASLIRKADAP